MNPLGINLWNYVNVIDENSLGLPTHVKKLGFTAVEIPMTTDILEPRFIEEILDTELEVSLCAAMFQGRDISNFDASVRASTLEYLTNCIKTANKLSAKIFAGPIYAGGGKRHFLNEDDKKREWEYAVSGLRILAKRAEDMGVDLALEPINRYRTSVVNTVEQALRMVGEIGCDNVGIHYDTYQAGIEEMSIIESMRMALESGKMFHFHACANNRMAPSQGFFPWEDIFKLLGDFEYDRHITMETFIHGGLDSGYVMPKESSDELALIGLNYMKKAIETCK